MYFCLADKSWWLQWQLEVIQRICHVTNFSRGYGSAWSAALHHQSTFLDRESKCIDVWSFCHVTNFWTDQCFDAILITFCCHNAFDDNTCLPVSSRPAEKRPCWRSLDWSYGIAGSRQGLVHGYSCASSNYRRGYRYGSSSFELHPAA